MGWLAVLNGMFINKRLHGNSGEEQISRGEAASVKSLATFCAEAVERACEERARRAQGGGHKLENIISSRSQFLTC